MVVWLIYADYKKIVNLFIQALQQIFQNYVSANTCKAERDRPIDRSKRGEPIKWKFDRLGLFNP